MHKKILYIVLTASVGVHLLFFFLLHNHSFRGSSTSHLGNMHFFYDEALGILQKKERTALLAQIFEHIEQAPREIKEELHELIPELGPMPLVAFPEASPTFEIQEGFSLNEESLVVNPSDEDLYSLLDGNPLISVIPALIASELPLLDCFQEERSYQGKGEIADSPHFDVDVEYAQKQNRPGYVFKIIFTPKQDVVFKRISQNYYFLIDRSNSIPRGRFIVNKRMVSEALNYLKPRDTFNILVFDDQVTRFSQNNLPWNHESVASAREFLQEQQHGGFFAATELYSSLGKIIPQQVSDHEVNTAILLSDGDSYLPIEQQRQTIGGWTCQNEGKISLFSIASGGGNNLPLLDLLSNFNKGALVYAMNPSDISERFIQLLKMIRNPIGKRMTATAIPKEKQMSIILQPKSSRLPYLYQNRPFVIYGSTNRLSDFVLFLQGNYYDSHFDIKKHISFSEARRGSPAIEKAWTQLVAQEFYERFLEDGNIKHLEGAEQLLTPLNLPVPLLNDPNHRR
ncbi:MAG: hypothetical protein ACKVOH_02895 [Chlamydiales bacterium]